MTNKFSISIVSHGHDRYIESLIIAIARLKRQDIEVILTLNIPEKLKIDFNQVPFPLRIIKNRTPKGFASNHNSAYAISDGENFVILNPDIELFDDPFDILLNLITQSPNSICAPLVINGQNEIEASARNFPSPVLLCKKLLSRICHFSLVPEILESTDEVIIPDWVAGMFVVIPRNVYANLHGLNEKYHMYYEDVDLCARARLAGYKILVSKHAKVIHEAQHDSHRKLRYLSWHIVSAFKFFTSSAYLKISWNRLIHKTSKF